MERTPASQTAQPMKVVIVAGSSDAGRSTAINALGDIGFEKIDDLALTFLPRLLSGSPIGRHLAFGLDTGNQDFSAAVLVEILDIISQEPGIECSLLYLDCNVEVPLFGIKRELVQHQPVRRRADILIDTTDMTPRDLYAEIGQFFGGESGQGLAVSVQSFSYKRGAPRGLNMVLDCRFLRNPYWDLSLRQLDGRDVRIAAHVADDPLYDEFFAKSLELVELLLPEYEAKGKPHYVIALGCTGGQHRSVCVAEAIANALAQGGWQVSIRHRELERRRLVAS